ncbi:MAG: ABC transporter permease, partial [Rhodobacteraceae bacterium]|nr:ABC transporter permease [Paracoccaceae bacterium]
MRLNALQRRRIANFRSNRRAFWSLWIFLALFLVTLCAEFVANDKPILVWFRGELKMPIFHFYSERDFGGEFATEAEYPSPEVRCLIRTGGLEACLDDP